MRLLQAGRTGDAGAPEPVVGPASHLGELAQLRYPLRLLRAVHRGLLPGQVLIVTVQVPSGEKIHGQDSAWRRGRLGGAHHRDNRNLG